MATQRHARPLNIRSREVQVAVDRAQHRRQRLIFALQVLFSINIFVIYRPLVRASLHEWGKTAGLAMFACYTIFSVWCVFRSSQRRLRWWDIVLSTILDYSLYIMVAMQLANAIAGGAPASDGLAAPSFSFVYLFIAMRCLHYSPAYVAFAGSMAALAWALLVTGPTAMSELMCIMLATLVLAACVREARSHLYTSALRGVAGKGLARFVGQDVANEVLNTREVLMPGKGRHETVAILMMDIRNFTKIAAKADPSDVIAMLAHYQQLVEPVIVKHGGVIDKFMGDGILAYFGALEQNPRFVAEAIHCVEDLLLETDRWNGKRIASGFKPFHFRVACAVGEAVVGLVGGATKVEFTIIGDPVNLTAKLEKHAKKLNARAVTTARAYEVARQQGFSPGLAARLVRRELVPGVEEPLDLVVIGDRLEGTRTSSGMKRGSRGRDGRTVA